jgi:two-component system sensor histidine kinase KdpD
MTRRDGVVLLAVIVLLGSIVEGLRSVPDVSSTTVALLMLLVVVGSATLARLRVAVVASLVAVPAFNFFFLPPVGTFTIADPQNWVALAAFLIVAVVASQLSARAQERAREAIARRNEVTRLFDLTRDVLLTTENTGAVEALARHIARRFELRSVAVCVPSGDGWKISQGGEADLVIDTPSLDSALARARGTLEFDARQRAYGGHVTAGPRGDVSLVPLRQGSRAIGLLATTCALDIGTLDAVGGVAAIAIERAQFLADREAAETVHQKAELASTLLASLSHDLRTPLTAIRVAVENLSGELGSAERRAQSTAAVAELDRLTRLIHDILDMARIDAGAIDVDRQWVTAADVADAALAHVALSTRGHALRVEAESDQEVQMDPRLVSAALAHVLENAAQYSPPDREILVTASVGRDGFRASVTDQGPGLDPQELDHLFERFYRGRTTRHVSYGTGMGLSITRGLLAAAGGRVWGENMPEGGARFTIAVPGAVRPVTVAQ